MSTRSIIATAIVGMSVAGCADRGDGLSGPAPEVDATVAGDLAFLREEEKLARDVYLTLYDAWGLTPHQNIASSEQTHTDRVVALLTAAGLEDPVVDDTVGVFVDARLAALYTELVDAGRASAVAALEVGATIEDLDIRDLDDMKARNADSTVEATYDALQCGSRNHLRTFAAQLASRGVTYSPQYLDDAAYAAIVTSDRETCGG